MEGLTYRTLQLKNGTTLFTNDEYEIPKSGEHSVTTILGLDGQVYEIQDQEVTLNFISTPESRHRLNELKHMLQAESAEFTHQKMLELEEALAAAQAEQAGERRAESVADALMRGAKPVQLA